MPRVPRQILLAIIVVAVLYFVYQRLRIVIFIPMSPWQALFFLAVVVGLLFLGLDHLINRDRK